MSLKSRFIETLGEQDDPSKVGTGGVKYDGGKPAIYRGLIDYFPRAITQVASVSTFGASKYAWKGWQSVEGGIARYSDGMGRHLISEAMGEDIDPDSGLLHASHTAWNALARLELMLREREQNANDA